MSPRNLARIAVSWVLLAGAALAAAPEGADAPSGPGPVPDFAPVAAITTHASLAELVPELPRTLSALLGPRHAVAAASGDDTTLLWMRDYQPLYVRRADGSLAALRSLSPNPNRMRPTTAGERVLPLLHENGNLVSTGRTVFVTDRLLEDNARPLPELAARGYRPRKPAEVLKILARAVGRPLRDVVVLPPLPREATGHVDLYLMALGPKTLLVPEVRDEAIALLGDEEEEALALDVRNFLDDQAARLTKRGFTVRRLPMMPPLLMPSVEADADERDMVVYSPTNAVLVRTADVAAVVLPSFDAPDRAEPWRALIREYERTWAEFFRERGWAPRFVDATLLGRYLGLFRCVTAMVPR